MPKSNHIGGTGLLRSRDHTNSKSVGPNFFSFIFDIMIHLPIHLVNEVRLGGPVQNRWMYSTEREMGTFKSYIRNRRFPEGCIAET